MLSYLFCIEPQTIHDFSSARERSHATDFSGIPQPEFPGDWAPQWPMGGEEPPPFPAP